MPNPATAAATSALALSALKTGRKQLIVAGLWTEICVALPAIQALGEGATVINVQDYDRGVFLSFVTLATGELWRMTGTMIVTRPTERIADDRPAHNKALVLDAMKALFQRHDPAAVERFYALGHVQHNPYIRQGRDELRALVAKLSPDVCYEPGITVAEGDFVPFMMAFAVGHPHRWWSLITPVSKMASLQSTGTCCKTKRRPRQRSAAHRCSIPKSALRKSDGRKFD